MNTSIIKDSDSYTCLKNKYFSHYEEYKLETYGKYISPKDALEQLVKGNNDPRYLDIIAKDSKCIIEYAQKVLRGRFLQGEEEILKDPKTCFAYARYGIRSRFFEGEHVIATNAHASYWYALEVIYGRFPAGEKIIATSPGFSYMYARDVVKGRFFLGEEAIKNSGFDWCIAAYENHIIKGCHVGFEIEWPSDLL